MLAARQILSRLRQECIGILALLGGEPGAVKTVAAGGITTGVATTSVTNFAAPSQATTGSFQETMTHNRCRRGSSSVLGGGSRSPSRWQHLVARLQGGGGPD